MAGTQDNQSATPQTDWAAEAAKFGGSVASSTQPTTSPVDWAAEAAKFGGSVVSQGTPIRQIRYTAPGQGVQEFTSGSPEEKQFLGRFPQAKLIPSSYTALANTPYQQAEAAEVAESNRKAANALKTGAIVAGSVIAPELAPELGGLAGVGLRAAATGAGAGVGTAVGQAATGENPVSKESLQESAKNAAIFGATDLGFGVAGKLVGKVAGAIKDLATPAGDVAGEGAILTRKIAGADVPGESQVVKNVQSQLDQAEAEMHTNYETTLNRISRNAKDVPVKLADSPLRETAQELLNDSRIPAGLQEAVKGVIPDSSRLNPLLEALSDENKTYSWDEVEATRQAIGGTIRKLPYDSPLRPDLIRIRSAIDETLQKAAQDAGNSQLAADMKALRASYAEKINRFQNTAIKTLTDKDPDAVADILLNKQNSIERVKDLRNLIGEDNMQQVEGSMLDRLIRKATVGDEVNANMLRKSFYRINPDVRLAIWGDNLPHVTAFMDGVVKNNARGTASSLLLNTLSHYGLGKGAAGGGLTGAIFGLIRGEDPEGILRDVAIGAAAGVGAKYAPQLLERYGPPVASAMGAIQRAVGEGGEVAAAGVPEVVAKKAVDEALEPVYAYRVRDVGDEGIPSGSHSATTSEEEARSYAAARGEMNGKPQEIVRTDLNNLDHVRAEGPNGNDWVKFNEEVPESQVEVLKSKTEPIAPIAQIKTEATKAAKAAGVEFRSIQEGIPGQHPGLAIFQDPESGTSVAVRLNEWSPEKLEEHVEDARLRMGVKEPEAESKITANIAATKKLPLAGRIASAAAAGAKATGVNAKAEEPAASETQSEPVAALRESRDIPDIVDEAAEANGIPKEIFRAQARQESGLNPKAISKAGAKGVMQLMDPVSEQFGVKDPYDPEQNIPAGAQYLAQLHRRLGHWDRALAAYNWGADRVKDAVDKHGDKWLDHVPAETRQYVRSILNQK